MKRICMLLVFLVVMWAGSFALAGSIVGRVVSQGDGKPIAGVQIRVYNKAWTWLYTKYTDDSGNYVVDGLRPGTYYLATSNAKGYLDKCYDDIQIAGAAWPPDGVKAVLLGKDSRVSDVSFRLDPGGTISGRVTGDSDGALLKDVVVTVFQDDWTPFRKATSDEEGRYIIQALPEGSFYLNTTNNQGYIDLYHQNGVHEEDAVEVEIKKGTGRDVSFRLAFGGSISGRVTAGDSGEGLQHVEIRVYDEKWALAKRGTTAPSGHFSIGGLPAGVYYVRTLSPGDYIDECFDDVHDSSSATAVRAKQGADSPGVLFSLSLGGSISGRVRAGEGGESGLQEVYVNVYDREGRHVGGALTDLSGRFTVRKIPPGKYYVQTSNALGYKDQYYNNTQNKVDATGLDVTAGAATKDVDFNLAN